jgi:osmotically-inducible protein OsmY
MKGAYHLIIMMKRRYAMKRYTPNSIHAGLFALFLFLPLQLSAGDAMDELNEARLEGQIWMAYALNEHLSVFDLEIDVNRSEATISGQVEDDVQKDLAEQVALDMSGIDSVDNRIEVTDDAIRRSHDDPSERTFRDTVADATTTATVKSKLLWNRNTGGLAIDVSTENGAVTLEGEADSDASKALAERLTANTDGVYSVNNRIRVDQTSGSDSNDSRGIDDVVSDSWITTKVRSTFIFTTNVPARSIGIETKDGIVILDGEVDDATAKELAIELASDIRGVRDVNSDNLRVVEGS